VLSRFKEDVRADRTDHEFSVGAVLAIRTGLFVDLAYQYRNRVLDSTVEDARENEQFTRNEILLSVTYQPTLRF
jgi:hypothetical protein